MTEHEKHILQNSKKQFYQKEIAYLKTRQGAFESHMLHFDHPLFACGVSLVASDAGAGAKKIRKNVEAVPLWQKLFQRQRLKLSYHQRAMLDALLVDWRTAFAARLSHRSTATIKRFKCYLRIHFAECHHAWQKLGQ